MKKAIVCLLIVFIVVLGSQQAKAYYLELVPGNINGQYNYFILILYLMLTLQVTRLVITDLIFLMTIPS